MSLTPFERETVVNSSDGDELVRIWTAQRKYIGRAGELSPLRPVLGAAPDLGERRMPAELADKWSPVGVKRSVSLTPEQREAAKARLLVVRGQLEFPS